MSMKKWVTSALALATLAIAPASQSAPDWKSVNGGSCTTQGGVPWCALVRETRVGSTFVAYSGTTALTVNVNGVGNISCVVYSYGPGDLPLLPVDSASGMRVGTGPIAFSAATLGAGFTKVDSGNYAVSCNATIVSYQWNEGP
jgi:hypothetical protein